MEWGRPLAREGGLYLDICAVCRCRSIPEFLVTPLPMGPVCLHMPGFQHYVSVHPSPHLRVPFQKYARITFIRSLRKNNVIRFRKFAVSFIRSNKIEFYFSVSVRVTVRKRLRQRRYGTEVRTRISETVNGYG